MKQLNPNSRAVATAAAIKDFATTRYTLGEEIANSITHGIGVVAAIAGLAVLTAFAVIATWLAATTARMVTSMKAMQECAWSARTDTTLMMTATVTTAA